MSGPQTLPRAARPFVEFPTHLRRYGFSVAPEQTVAFLAAIELLGPGSIEQIRRACHATLAPPRERHGEFDALFDGFFIGREIAALAGGEDDDDDMQVFEEGSGEREQLVSEEDDDVGQQAATIERLSQRQLAPTDALRDLRRLAREAPQRLPRRRGLRRSAYVKGKFFDLRRSLREAIRHDGEVMHLPRMRRKTRQRPILVLIDVSGSMKDGTDARLGFAHALKRSADRVEVFTLGTRLTRVTKSLGLRDRSQALAAASETVSDWDGGTRIGDALQALLAVPRFSGFARGALVLVLSDGLERGEPAAMIDAARRLSRLAWKVCWLTPLASDPAYAPQTEALSAVLPYLDDLADGSSTAQLCDYVINIAEARAA
jgi:hypothetical protein